MPRNAAPCRYSKASLFWTTNVPGLLGLSWIVKGDNAPTTVSERMCTALPAAHVWQARLASRYEPAAHMASDLTSQPPQPFTDFIAVAIVLSVSCIFVNSLFPSTLSMVRASLVMSKA